jgi:predicted methyltransferase
MARKARKGPKTLYDKINDIDKNFTSEVYALSQEQLNAKLSEMAKTQTETEDAKSKDTDLKSKQEQAKEAGKVYGEIFKALKMKRQFVIQVLQERGKA